MPPTAVHLKPIDERHFVADGQVFSFDDFDNEGRPRTLSAGRIHLRVN
jgi:hypothetical protein